MTKRDRFLNQLETVAETAQQLLDETGNDAYEFYAKNLARIHRAARTELNRDQLAKGIAEVIG